ncbi:hypothetical protein E4T56_gene2777 [Termitomyces sp. T112]|nr:hypothetical protein E4T56_gene2777 [Termitomyces sp. T112]
MCSLRLADIVFLTRLLKIFWLLHLQDVARFARIQRGLLNVSRLEPDNVTLLISFYCKYRTTTMYPVSDWNLLSWNQAPSIFWHLVIFEPDPKFLVLQDQRRRVFPRHLADPAVIVSHGGALQSHVYVLSSLHAPVLLIPLILLQHVGPPFQIFVDVGVRRLVWGDRGLLSRLIFIVW